MQTYVSILRGINVGGHKKIKMADLKSVLEENGLKAVTTYIQSGNLIFNAEKTTESKLSDKIQKIIEEHFGYEVPVLTRNREDLESIIKQNPFLKEKDVEMDKLHITFLSNSTDVEGIKKMEEYNFSPDRFIIADREIYIYCPNGYGNTKITNNFFESKLNVTATSRNWKTVQKLAALAGEL